MPSSLTLDTSLFVPGMRLAIGLSGGADSVALLLALHERNREPGRELGLVLHAAHLHHGLRGAEADDDLAFCRDLAAHLDLPFHHARVDTAAEAAKAGQGIEEAARRLRYAWFRSLIAEHSLDAVLTAHTLDDQAETVLAKFLRGAWTDGLSGIYPRLEEGPIVRPLLGVTRAEVEVFLRERGQAWRADSTNRNLTFTRNRIRHELLPELERWNPRLREHLAQMASLARDEESAWDAEIARIAPRLLLPGKPVRGGGRSAAGGLAIDVTRLSALSTALQRRLLRHAAGRLGFSPDFAATESMRELALRGRAGQRLELAHGFRVERSHRELRLGAEVVGSNSGNTASAAYTVQVPGEVTAEAFRCRVALALCDESTVDKAAPAAMMRAWRPGDRVRLRYSSSPRKVKEVLERLHVTGEERTSWPVLEWRGQIVWMRGAEVEPAQGLRITVTAL